MQLTPASWAFWGLVSFGIQTHGFGVAGQRRLVQLKPDPLGGDVEMLISWDAIGAIGEILGAIAVLVTLVFLARQISQNNQLGKAEAEREWFATWHGVVARLMGSAEAADLLRSGLDHYSSLSANDQAVLSTRLIAFFDHADVLRRLAEDGFVSADIRERVVGVCLGILRTPGGAEWWAQIAPATMFYEYFDSLPRDDVRPINDALPYLSPPP